MSSISGTGNEIPQPADPQAQAHSSGIMGTRPSQAMFIGNLAIGLLLLMVVATAFVLIAAMTYGNGAA